MLRRTARWCDGFFPVDVSPPEYLDALDRIKGYADGFDRDGDGLTKAIHLFFRLGRTKHESRASAQRILNRRRGFEVELPDDGRFGFGTVSDCLRTIESFVEIGVSHFVFNPLIARNRIEGQLERLASEVIPRFK